MSHPDSYGARADLRVGDTTHEIFRLDALQSKYDVARLPYSLKVLLENLLRNEDGQAVTAEDIENLARWVAGDQPSSEIAYTPARVLMQDFTGVPAIVDLAAMRDAMADLGGDPGRINPLVPVELVIDHSIQVDVFAEHLAFQRNAELEFERNHERYAFLRWGQTAFEDFAVVPPNTGICHQVNLEYLARVVETRDGQAFPDTLVGTDSHTTMVNGLGVLGWGVGGIEAEAAMLGQPVSMLIPQVVGFRLDGRAARGRHRHRPGAHRHPDAARARRGGQVRGVLRSRPAQPAPGRPGHDRQHVARDGRHLRDLPGGRRDAALPRVHRPPGRAGGAGGGLLPGAGPLPRARRRGGRLLATRWSSTSSTVVPCLAGPRRPQDRVALTNAASDFRSELGELMGEAAEHEPENGSLDQSVAESFPASDPGAPSNPGAARASRPTSTTRPRPTPHGRPRR